MKKVTLFGDVKFRWLVFSIAVVGVFEILSLAGWELPPRVAVPFFTAIILATSYRTIWHGLVALARLNFRSINLLMIVAVAGAFYTRQYPEAAVVIVLFTLAERLEEYGIAASKSALQALVDRTPKTATIKEAQGKTNEVPLTQIRVGDTLVIKPAEMIAMDSEVVFGSSSVDESTITGEPLPKDKHAGDMVFAGTLNMQGYLETRVAKEAQDSTLAKIIEITFAATKTKAETQKFIENFSSYYTPIVLFLALHLVAVPVLFFGRPFDTWFREALTLLVIACPCALVISTPISIYAAIGNASARGALIKGGKYVEAIGRVGAIALDKTRTLTYGKLKVTDVLPIGGSTREHLLACAAGIESYSEHPLAQAIVTAARGEKLDLHAAKNFQATLGKGAKADCVVCYDAHHCIGKLPFITEEHDVKAEVVKQVESLQREGKTSIIVSNNDGVEGIIALTDELKPESKDVIVELTRLHVETIMLTGDSRAPAEEVARAVGITQVRAELLPEDKAEAIRELTKQYSAVAMVGDGVNDAPALALAAVGIAMGAAGSDTAIESASIALLNDRLGLVPYLVRLGRKTISTIKINTAIAILTKLIFVALALAGWSSLALAIFADVGVTVIVIVNSLRLLKFEPTGPLKDARGSVALAAGILLVSGLVLALTNPVQAQTPKPSVIERPVTASADAPLIINTDLVTITATVTEREGRHVCCLDKSAFTVYDDGVPQRISFLSDADAPVSLAVVFDLSTSMSSNQILRAKKALAQFRETSHREDEYFLIGFNERVQLLLEGALDAHELYSRLADAKADGSTALYDAVYLSIDRVERGSRPRRAILLITDGLDTSSRYKFKELRRSLQESDAVLYAIGLLSNSRFERRQGRSVLEELASISGGKAFFPDGEKEMSEAFDRIALELRHQYSLGYRPSDLGDNSKWHRVKIAASLDERQKLRVRNREGFYALANRH